jgi:hypothetical protein
MTWAEVAAGWADARIDRLAAHLTAAYPTGCSWPSTTNRKRRQPHRRLRDDRRRLRRDVPAHLAAARTHNADMAKYNHFSHTGRGGSSFVDRAKRAGYTAAIGENREHRLGLPQA